ncbi:MAG: hypothetical protein J6V68_02700 [Clostridia bacterium]|nr:hypothetical protein [Clostridia bacterium]
MFGYVKPDNPNLFVKDETLYKATYCGLCKSIGKTCGQTARFTLSYDLAFLTHFIHNVTDTDLTIKKEHCLTHWIVKRPVAKTTDISCRIANLNVILAFYKLKDDVLDSKKGKIKQSVFLGAYRKAKKNEPQFDLIVKNGFEKLLNYERSFGDSASIASEIFGEMLADIVKELCGEHYSDDINNLAFNLGKWIYLIDALDDFEKDLNKNEYNPFKFAYKDIVTKKELLEKHGEEICFLFNDALWEIENSNKNIKYYFNHDLIDNILLRGLRKALISVMEVK